MKLFSLLALCGWLSAKSIIELSLSLSLSLSLLPCKRKFANFAKNFHAVQPNADTKIVL